MNSLEAFEIYLALKLHFNNSKYDYFKYNGKVKGATKESLHNRKDKFFFQKLAKTYSKDDYIKLVLSNLIDNPKTWVGNLLKSDCQKIYRKWHANIENIEYNFKQDLFKIFENVNTTEDFDNLFKCNKGHPKLFQMLINGDINKETFLIFNSITNFCENGIEKKIPFDPMWKEYKKILYNYAPFLKIDKIKYRKMIGDMIKEKGLI